MYTHCIPLWNVQKQALYRYWLSFKRGFGGFDGSDGFNGLDGFGGFRF